VNLRHKICSNWRAGIAFNPLSLNSFCPQKLTTVALLIRGRNKSGHVTFALAGGRSRIRQCGKRW
jgi:hypothetical protein